MKAFKMKDRPAFDLVKQDSVGSSEYLQMPRWLLSEQNPLSLEATVAYTLLFNRMQLSKRNGWVNELGEVFLICTRDEISQTLKIGYRRATAVMRELIDAGMIWEKRVGRGFPNQIYIADRPELHTAPSAAQERTPFKNEQTDGSRTAAEAVLEPSIRPTSNKDNNKKDKSDFEKSLSTPPACANPCLDELLKQSETDSFPNHISAVFTSAITRLYNAKRYDSDAGVLKRREIRQHLKNLNSVVLEDVRLKVTANMGNILVSHLGYVTQAILNAAIADGGRSNRGMYFPPEVFLCG